MVRGILQDKNLNTTMPLFWADKTNLPPITKANDSRRIAKEKVGIYNTNTKKDLDNEQPITVEVLIGPKFGHNTEPVVKNQIKQIGSTRCATPTPKPGFTRLKGSSLKDAQRPCERPKLRKTMSCSTIKPVREENCKARVPGQATGSIENSKINFKTTRHDSSESSNKVKSRPVTRRTTKCITNDGYKKVSFAKDEDVSQITPEFRKQTNEQFLDGKTKSRIIKWLTEVEIARQINEPKSEKTMKQNEANEKSESNDSEPTLPMIDEEDTMSSIK